MPGIIYHLAFAEEVYRHLAKKNAVNQLEFFSGNLIPDLVVAENKNKSHYRVPASVQGFVVPNMEAVKKDLYDLNNSLKMGMYCHLYLDYHFFETFKTNWLLIQELVKVGPPSSSLQNRQKEEYCIVVILKLTRK